MWTSSTVIWEKRGRYPPQRLDLPRFRYVFVDDVRSRLLYKVNPSERILDVALLELSDEVVKSE